MSVVGFDIGNESCIVAVARQRGIDVVLNDESKRETPAVVCFGEKQRFIGTAGASSALMNPKNTVSQVKRLIGKLYSDPDVQRDLQSLPFMVTEGNDGTPLIHVRYLGENRTFTPTQILAMILSNLKQIAKDNLKTEIVDCCIGIPVYFTDLERRAVLDAASIVNLNPLCLLHETTATALAYGIYKTDLPETDPLNVVFVDIGHASMQVCVAAFKKGELKVLAHAFDRSLGGRDFDEVLFRHFAEIFKSEYQIDVPTNVLACHRLRAACEKLKKDLSANPEAQLNIECLMDEKDVRGFIRRDEFEQLSFPILERVKGPCERALFDAWLTVDKIHSVEVVGSGSRVPSILKILTEFFGKEPRRTLNASECVARGCALQCAILSPTFKVRDFKIQESFPFSIALSWKGSTPDIEDRSMQHLIVFPKGNTVPSMKLVTFFRSGTFRLDFLYADPSQVRVQQISSYTIGSFQTPNGEKAKVKLKVQLDKNGVVWVTSATMTEEVELPVTPAKENAKEEKETVAMETDGKTALMETDSKVKVVKMKKTKRIELPLAETIFGGLARAELQKATEKEFEMALQDRIMEETKEKKNAVEAYVYDMHNKDALADIETLKEQLRQALKVAENARAESRKETDKRKKAEAAAVEANYRIKELECAEEKVNQISCERNKAIHELQAAKQNLAAMKEQNHRILQEKEAQIRLLENCLHSRPPLETLSLSSSSSSNLEFTEYTFDDVKAATSNFSEHLKLGEGGYGIVYKGEIRQTIAVKILRENSLQGRQEFEREIDILREVRHPHLVRVVGACFEQGCVIYEYMSNGCLAGYLSSSKGHRPLPWQARIRIAAEICSALQYLHSFKPHPIVHRDLKPENILLDENYMSKISDFGLARPLPVDSRSQSEPKGTFCYMDPEYLISGRYSTKSDVYSLGIVILQLLTGKPALRLAQEVKRALESANLEQILDPSAGDWPFVQASQLAYLALQCTDRVREKRPDLQPTVMKMLNQLRNFAVPVYNVGRPVERGRKGVQNADELQVPGFFLCPIFKEVMRDPYVATDGYTYEKEAIQGWFDCGKDTSPMTNKKLVQKDLIPNFSLRSAIRQWVERGDLY